MECVFCGKTLITSAKFLNENDVVECSNCKNTFKFIPANLIKKNDSDSSSIQSNECFIFFIYRLLIPLLSIALYYFASSSTESLSFTIFAVINFLPVLTASIIFYTQNERLIDYRNLLDDKIFNTPPFWIIFFELTATILLNLIFFIIF
ncbi:hypothetical protein KA977_07950 [Candidatus Dependentiae bacterium]|nr:hypothetical protein [Candidatus Dependentiae bacterium]